MRASACLSVGLFTLVGCASPKPRAQRLINYSVNSGEPINTADGQKLICKQESVTNTRLKNKKICLTPEQWQARTDNAKDAFKDARDAGDYLPPKGN